MTCPETERPLDLSIPDDMSIPTFLQRDSNNESEFTKMNPLKTIRPHYAADEATATAEPDAPAPAKEKAPKKAKTGKPAKAAANGHGKAKAQTKGTLKASAKNAPKATAKVAKGKAKAPAAERTRDPTKLDAYGFRLGSVKSQAAAIYAKGKGATLAEVKDALGSVQFNLLTEVKAKGYDVEETEVKGTSGRMVTRYKIVTKG